MGDAVDTVIESNSALAGIVAFPLSQSPISTPAQATVESPYASPELGSVKESSAARVIDPLALYHFLVGLL
jgi:hypothetical protein